MKQKQHCSELTVMSGIAILFVLGIHGCGSALNRFYPGMSYADVSVLVCVLSNLVAPAVPMFLFVSGCKYGLNDTKTPYWEYLRKRLPRVIMSFAILNTLFWALDCIVYMDRFDPILLAKTYLHSWVGYSVAYQLWYIPMYCFVIAVCPLVRRILPGTALRFFLYAGVGIVQRMLEVRIPVLATYPIRFISYPVFFELGVLAQERKWGKNLPAFRRVLLGGAYVFLAALLSWLAPEFSTNGLTKYLVYYFGGTAAFFLLSIAGKESRFLRWTGEISYPLFLLHEPLIGRLSGAKLGAIPGFTPAGHAVVWVVMVYAVTAFLIYCLKAIRVDRFLWKFKL